MRKVSKIIFGILMGMMVFWGEAGVAQAYTCDSGSVRVKSGGSAQVNSPAECAQPKEEREVGSSVTQIVNVVLGVLGVVAVLVIIIGGIMYVTSTGDASMITRAKNMIQYAIIGLIISLLAWAIVNFVVGNVFSS